MYLLFFSSLVRSEGCGASVVSARLQLALFPGREARTHWCTLFSLLFCFCVESPWLVWCSECVYWLDVLFWTSGYDCSRKTVARPVNLARASQSRLGEMNRELAQDFCAKGRPGDQLDFWASPRREGSRLSEIPRVLLLPFSSPRLGEGGARLSEHVSPERGAGRDSVV